MHRRKAVKTTQIEAMENFDIAYFTLEKEFFLCDVKYMLVFVFHIVLEKYTKSGNKSLHVYVYVW